MTAVQMSKIVIWLKLVILLKIVLHTQKLHLHGRLLSARIEILPFFFFKSRKSLTRRKIHERFCLRSIATHAPKKNQTAAVIHTGEILTRRSHTIATRRSHLQAAFKRATFLPRNSKILYA